jgi:hypothetical protein
MDTWQVCTPNEQGADHRCYAYSCDMGPGQERFDGISGHWPATTAAAKATIVTPISAGLA